VATEIGETIAKNAVFMKKNLFNYFIHKINRLLKIKNATGRNQDTLFNKKINHI